MTNHKLFYILLVLMLPTVSIEANPHSAPFPIDSVPSGTEQMRLSEIEGLLTRSPHHKNRNAAGRLSLFNRTAPVAAESTREKPSGPAYKNRKRASALSDATRVPKFSRRMLTGPRYKNRGAKTHRSHHLW